MANMQIDEGRSGTKLRKDGKPDGRANNKIGGKGKVPREPVHQETPVVAAREQEREAVHSAPRRRRRHSNTVSEDRFYIPLDEIPDGLSYEWKRFSLVGQEDPFHIAKMRDQGWEPVPASRHPNWLPPGYSEANIIKDGQMLMDRPMELTLEAQDEQRTLAKRQVREAEQRLGMTPNNTLPRDADPRTRPVIDKQMMRPVVISEE